MTKKQYIESHRHQLAGLVLEAQMHPRTGAELSVSLRGLFARIDAILAEAWDDAHQDNPPQPGGPTEPKPAAGPAPNVRK